MPVDPNLCFSITLFFLSLSPFIFDFVREETSSFFASSFFCKVPIAHFAFSYRSKATKHTPTTLNHGIHNFRQDDSKEGDAAASAFHIYNNQPCLGDKKGQGDTMGS